MLSDTECQLILEKLKPLQPSEVALFGSFARGTQTKSSDIDILIDSDSGFNLLDLIGIEQELAELLGRKVDVVTRRSLSPHFKPFIESSLIPLL